MDPTRQPHWCVFAHAVLSWCQVSAATGDGPVPTATSFLFKVSCWFLATSVPPVPPSNHRETWPNALKELGNNSL